MRPAVLTVPAVALPATALSDELEAVQARLGRLRYGGEEALDVAMLAGAALLRTLEPERAVELAAAELADVPRNVLPFRRRDAV